MASERDDGILLPMVQDALMRLVEKGVDPAKVEEIASEVVVKTIPELARVLATALHRSKASLIKGLAEDRAALMQEIEHLWGPAFATYEAIAYGAYELGRDLHDLRHRRSETPKLPDPTKEYQSEPVDIMSLLHGRACTVALEVLTLLRAGLAEGAAARQRTLHELAVVINLLTEHQDLDLASRYADYAIVEQYEDMEHYQAHAATLGQVPFSQAEMDALRAQYQEVLQRRGERFKYPHQWAAPLFPGEKKITFPMLEAKVKMEHLRPYYRYANHFVHAGPRAATLNLRLSHRGWAIGAGARADADIAEVGHAALVSLLQCTTPFVISAKETEPSLDHLVQLKALFEMLNHAGIAFQRGARRL